MDQLRRHDAILLRRGRLAGDGARPRLAVGLADPVPPRVRPVREPAPGAADAGHAVAARRPQARRHRLLSSCARTPRASTRRSAARMFEGTEREIVMQQAIFTRKGVDRILKFAFELARKRPKKHLTSATKSNGISITMPYWDERVRGDGEAVSRRAHRQVPHRHPDRALRAAAGVLRRGRRRPTCSATSCRTSGPPCCGTIGIAPSAQHQPGAHLSRRCSSRCTARRRTSPGKGIANPIGQIWSGAMMLDFLGYSDAAAAVVGGHRTRARRRGRAEDAGPRRPRDHGRPRARDRRAHLMVRRDC